MIDAFRRAGSSHLEDARRGEPVVVQHPESLHACRFAWWPDLDG